MICPHCKQDVPANDMLDDILDHLVEQGLVLKPSQARKIREDVLASGISPIKEAA